MIMAQRIHAPAARCISYHANDDNSEQRDASSNDDSEREVVTMTMMVLIVFFARAPMVKGSLNSFRPLVQAR